MSTTTIPSYRSGVLLADKGDRGDDDYFSESVPTESSNDTQHPHPHPLKTSFGQLAAPTLALFSSGDAPHQRGDIKAKLRKWEQVAAGKLTTSYVEGASHDVVEADAQERMCKTIVDWLDQNMS